jgi:D-cysteine desulfhydrase
MMAGLLAGVRAVGKPCRVVGVGVWSAWAANRGVLAWMARRALVLARGPGAPSLSAREVEVELGQLGAGYGYPTEAAREAQALFARDGVALELTYTGKAAAALLAIARTHPHPRRCLLWYSMPKAPPGPLLSSEALAQPELLRLLR